MSNGDARRVWPWVLGVGVALVSVWVIATMADRTGPPEPEGPAAGAVDGAGGADAALTAPSREPAGGAAAEDVLARTEAMRSVVRQYEDRCQARLEPAAGEGLEAVVVECVQRLNAALDAVVASDTVGELAIEDRLRLHREAAARLRSTPPGEGRVGPTRAVLRSAAEVLAVIADERYPESLEEEGALRDIRAAAESLDPDRPLSRQQELLQAYFLGAGALLSAMARPGDPGPGG